MSVEEIPLENENILADLPISKNDEVEELSIEEETIVNQLALKDDKVEQLTIELEEKNSQSK